MSLRHRAPNSTWRLSAGVVLYCAAVTLATQAKQADATLAEASFESTPVLLAGHIPIANLFIALSRLPADPRQRQKLVDELGRAVDRLPDASIRLGWLVPSACNGPSRANSACLIPTVPRPLDAAVRAEFKRAMAGIELSGDAASDAQAESNAANAIAVVEQSAALRASRQVGDLCRQSHIVLVGVDVASGTQRPAPWPREDLGTPSPTLHRIAFADDAPADRIDRALQTVWAESLGLDASRTSALAAVPAAAGAPAKIVAARYTSHGWGGELATRNTQGAKVDTTSAPWGRQADWGVPHTTATLLNDTSPERRVIFSSRSDGLQLKGIPWRWTELSQEQRAELDQDAQQQQPDGLGEQRTNWLRGVRENEQINSGPLRDRRSLQADMLGGVPWVAPGRPSTPSAPPEPTMIYAPGNGAMLHAFDAATGAERFAYVPQGAVAKVPALSRPEYIHLSSVAASPFTAEWQEAGQARRWLFGMLGAGGRGYFALDVGDLAGFADESRAALQVRLDTTESQDRHLGHVFGSPVTAPGDPSRSASVVRLTNGRTAVVLGNGFGSKSGQAALLIQYLDGARELSKIAAGASGGNGLGPARLVDIDGDQKADVAYAGDLQGRLWKFDMQGADPAQWRVALNGRPVFTAKDEHGRAQPITTAPIVWPHPRGGRMVVLGTGRLLTADDRGDASTQSIYGIHDRDDDEPISSGRAALRQRSLQMVVRQAGSNPSPSPQSDAPVNPASTPASTTALGWYIDLPLAGERTLIHPAHFDGQLIDIFSTIPMPAPLASAGESCEPASDRQFLNTVRAVDGEPPRSVIYGTSASPRVGGRIELSVIPGATIRDLSRESRTNFDGVEDESARMRLGFTAVRPAWRQLQ